MHAVNNGVCEHASFLRKINQTCKYNLTYVHTYLLRKNCINHQMAYSRRGSDNFDTQVLLCILIALQSE